jgi:spore germination protein YaaH
MMRRGLFIAALVSMAALPLTVPSAGAVTARPRTAISSPTQVVRAEQLVGVALPASGALAPSPNAAIFRTPLAPHIVLGFIGAGGIFGVTSAEFADVSEFVTNMTSLTASGALSTTTPGWTDLNNPSFPNFVTTAHSAGDRVLLGIANGSAASLTAMLRDPASAAIRLATGLIPLLAADHLDGVDLDIEVGAVAERGPFTTFTTALERALARAAHGIDLIVNVEPTSASTLGFFNVQALARVASALFVMDYDMVPGGAAGPNAPLLAAGPQVSDLSSLLAYTSVVSPSKLILGIPFYGYDFPTRSRVPGSLMSGAAESVTYADIVSVGHIGHWDATALSPYYVFRRGKQWHETFYDDPVSVALKTALASVLHLSGVGVWSLGQEGSSTAMLGALDGRTSPKHLSVASSSA